MPSWEASPVEKLRASKEHGRRESVPGYMKSQATDKRVFASLAWIQTGPGTTPAYKRIGPRALAVEAAPCPTSFWNKYKGTRQRLDHRS